MIKRLEKLFKITTGLVVGSVVLWSCEPDADQLGSQYFQNGAVGTETAYPIIAYNVNNNDSIRTDAVRLQSATIGAFNESKFGMQKSDYITQVRLSSFNPDFGTNAVLDSAVLILKPNYQLDSVTTDTKEDYVFEPGAIAAKKVVTTYPIIKYGKAKIGGKTTLNLKVHEVTEFLGSNATQVKSTKNPTTGALLGSLVFKGDITGVNITKKDDNSTLLERTPSIRMKLDSTFFQTKIIKGAATNMTDAASFIRYFKGLKFSVDENDGYIFSFDPNTIELKLYYKNDNVSGTTTTRQDQTFALDLGSQNVHFSHIAFDRSGTPSSTIVQDTISGAPRIYAQGMGGPGIGLRIPGETIASIRDMYNSQKVGIISAKIRLYTDTNSWTNTYKKPDYFVVKQKGLDTFLADINALAYTGVYQLVKAVNIDTDTAHYDIDITQTVKNIIEEHNPSYGHFIANVGSYTQDVQGTLLGSQYPALGPQNFNTRSYTPYRTVLIGTEAGNEKSAKLYLIYGKK